MRLRNPFIALVILIGLGAYVYLVEMQGEDGRQEEQVASKKIFSIPRDEMKEIVLVQGDERIRLEREGEDWQLREPVPASADRDSLRELLDSLDRLRTEQELGLVENLSPYELDSPNLEVHLRRDSEETEQSLFLGTKAPTGGHTYARRGEAGEVLLVSGAEGLQDISSFSLRDKSLLGFDPAQVTGCRLIRQEGELALVSVEGEWRLTTPVLAPAERSSVAELLIALNRLEVTGFLNEDPDPDLLRSRNLEPARFRVVLAGEEWEGEKELRFGDLTEEGLLAQRPGSGELVQVSPDLESKLANPILHFRKKKAIPFSRFEVERLRIEGLLPDPLVLIKQEEEWLRESPGSGPVDGEAVDLLLKQLSDLRADIFLDGPATAGKLDVDPPMATLEFWKSADGEGKSGVIEIGHAKAEGKIAVKNPAWPSVMLVDAASWEEIPDQIRRLADPEPERPAESDPAATETP